VTSEEVFANHQVILLVGTSGAGKTLVSLMNETTHTIFHHKQGTSE
jgi:flagellar biosynthesis GTPase FlhF